MRRRAGSNAPAPDAVAAYAGHALGVGAPAVRPARGADEADERSGRRCGVGRGSAPSSTRSIAPCRGSAPDSELTALNRVAGTGRWSRVSWRLREALAAMDRAGRITGRAVRRRRPRQPRAHRRTRRPAGRRTRRRRRRLAMPRPRGLERPRPVRVPGVPSTRAGSARGSRCAGRPRGRCRLPAAGLGAAARCGRRRRRRGPGAGGRLAGRDRGPARARGRRRRAAGRRSACDAGAVATSSVSVRHWTDPAGGPCTT